MGQDHRTVSHCREGHHRLHHGHQGEYGMGARDSLSLVSCSLEGNRKLDHRNQREYYRLSIHQLKDSTQFQRGVLVPDKRVTQRFRQLVRGEVQNAYLQVYC